MTERHFLAGLVFRLLRPEHAAAGTVDDRALTLRFRQGSERIPLRYISSLDLSHDLARSTLTVRHAAGTAVLSGLAPSEASDLASSVNAARQHWWTRTLAAERDTLTALDEILRRFDTPSVFLTADRQRRIAAAARACLRNLAGEMPESLRETPLFPALDRVRIFLDDPDETRRLANAHYIHRELIATRELLDTIESRPLTPEQRAAVVTDERSNLVVASAGSGKTSVIVAKAAWLIQRRRYDPSDLLLLAFAREARAEMQQRIETRMGASAPRETTVLTFHSLGRSIMGEVEGRAPSLSRVADDPKALTDLLKDLVSDLLADPFHSENLLAWLQNRHTPYRGEHEFESLGDYYAYIRQYDLRSLQGEKVRSFEECEIANFLYLNGVAYEYEPAYEHDTATSRRRQYRPDFMILEPRVYIEHFALDSRGRTPPFIDRERYLAERAWKRDLHARHGTPLIETYSHQHRHGILHRTLANELSSHGIVLRPIPPETVFAKLEEQGRIAPFLRLASVFLHHFKSAGLNYAELSRRAENARGRERAHAFVDIFRPIADAYHETMRKLDQIDFNDMIHCAADYVENGKYRSPYKYILIDEFQDISPARARLIKALVRQSPDNRLFAVGDDWQAISRYAGSDISIIRDFGNHFGDHEQLRLETTFRCPDRLAALATEFILKNPSQIPKTVRSTRTADGPCVHIGLAANPGVPLVVEALGRIHEHARTVEGEATVLVIARYNHLLQPIKPLQKRHPALRVAFKSVHASKGLEADYVILVGLNAGKYAFPTEIVDDPLLDLVLATPETHAHAEERRLFYVALTRARRRIYLVCDGPQPSSFATELVHGDYDVTLFGRPPAPDVACPACTGGKLQPRKRAGANETFYACTNYPYCEHTQPSCPECRTGLPSRTDQGVHCPNCGHELTACPVCPGWLRERTGPKQSFLGCVNYPVCKHTQPLDSTAQPASASAAPAPRSPGPAANESATPPTAPARPKSAEPPAPPPPTAAARSREPAAPLPPHRDSTPPKPPSDRDRPRPPLRIGDSVRFPGGGQTVEGHLLQPRLAKKRAHVIDAEGGVWKVRDIDMTPAPDIPRRNVIITPANETRASLRLGDTVSFRAREGRFHGTIVKLNPSRALVEGAEDTWEVLYLAIKPTPGDHAEKNRQRLHAVAAAARALMDRHGLSDWTLAFSESRTQLGQCVYAQLLIRIALQHALDGTAQDIRDTVLHEIAHAIAGPDVGHGPAWKNIAARIGATPRASKHEPPDTATSRSTGQAM